MTGSEVRRPERSTSSHLLCRNGVFYLRVRVPNHLKERVGSSEVRRSLHVHHPRTARRLALKYSARVFEAFDMLSCTPLTKDQARRLVEGCFADLKARAEHGFVPETSRPDIEIAEQRDLSRDFIQRRLEHIETQSYPADVRVHAMIIARRAGISFCDQPISVQLDLMKGWHVPRSNGRASNCSGWKIVCRPLPGSIRCSCRPTPPQPPRLSPRLMSKRPSPD